MGKYCPLPLSLNDVRRNGRGAPGRIFFNLGEVPHKVLRDRQQMNIFQFIVAQGLLGAQEMAGKAPPRGGLPVPEKSRQDLAALKAGHARRQPRKWRKKRAQKGRMIDGNAGCIRLHKGTPSVQLPGEFGGPL